MLQQHERKRADMYMLILSRSPPCIAWSKVDVVLCWGSTNSAGWFSHQLWVYLVAGRKIQSWKLLSVYLPLEQEAHQPSIGFAFLNSQSVIWSVAVHLPTEEFPIFTYLAAIKFAQSTTHRWQYGSATTVVACWPAVKLAFAYQSNLGYSFLSSELL